MLNKLYALDRFGGHNNFAWHQKSHVTAKKFEERTIEYAVQEVYTGRFGVTGDSENGRKNHRIFAKVI